MTTEALDVAGAARSYVLGVPSTYDASRAYPLVLGFHGDGGDGAGIRAALSFEAVSGQDAIVAYPSGHGHTWDLYGPAATNGDVDFITKLVGALEQRFNVTPDRVFGIGFSNGAFMLNQLACRRPSLFRAIVPLSGGAPYEPQDSGASHWENGYVKCAGQTLGSGPAVLVVHGTQDAVVSYESGDFSAKYWSYVNGCGEASSAWSIQPCVSYAECPTGKSVLFCPIAAMGHAIWSEATKAAWTFFSGL